MGSIHVKMNAMAHETSRQDRRRSVGEAGLGPAPFWMGTASITFQDLARAACQVKDKIQKDVEHGLFFRIEYLQV